MAAKLKYVFGFHCTINQGIAFYNNKTVLFLAGEMCVLHDMEQNEQKFLPFTELSIPTAITQGQRNTLAVADKRPSRRVILYDIERPASRKLFVEPNMKAEEYICLCFSHDFQYLAAQAGPPDWAMVVWKCEKRTLRTVYFPTSMRSGAEIYQIRFHPSDNDKVIAVGKEYLRLYKFEDEEGFKPHVFAKHEPYGDYLCTEWLSQGWLAVGTADGRILFFDGMDETYHVAVAKEYVPESGQDQEEIRNVAQKSEENLPSMHVTCLVSTPRGLICTYDESAAIEYARTEDNRHYKFKRAIHIPKASTSVLEDIGEMETSKHRITFMKLSPNAELLLVCTDIGQLFSRSLIGEDITKGEKLYFTVVTQPVHRHAIIGMDVAVKMSLVVTCSQQTIILWDYIKKARIMRKCFHHAILCVAIHPLGLHLVIGFSERTRVFTILSDGLELTTQKETKNCTEAMFAHGGHMLALANGSNIEIYDFITMGLVAQLNGHQGTITGIDWNRGDTMIFSCDTEGDIFGWNVITKEKIVEIRVENGTAISAISAAPEGNYLYVVGADNTIKQFSESVISQTVQSNVELTALAISYTGLLLFSGTKKGCLKTLALPLSASAGQVDLPAHLGKINKLKFALKESYVLTAGADGMLCIWQIVGKEKTAKPEEFSEAVLIDQDDLKECVETVELLKAELTEIQEDARHKLENKHAFLEQHVHAASRNLEQKIEDLNATLQRLSHENKIVSSQTKDKEVRIRELGLIKRYMLEGSTLEKILKEHARSQKLRFTNRSIEDSLYQSFHEVRNKCENDLKQVLSSREEELMEKEKRIIQVNEELRRKEEEHKEICKQLQDNREDQLAKVKANFARDIHLQKEEIEKLKEAHEIALKKIHRQQKTIDELEKQIDFHLGEEARLKGVISEIEKGINETQKTINKKLSNIQELQERILHLQGMKQNLEKHKFVLNSALKNQTVDVEQNDGITEAEEEQIEALQAELDLMHATQKKLEVEAELIGNKMKSIQKELEKEKNKVTATEHVLEKYKSDLVLCAAVIDEPQKLKNSVRTLLESHNESPKQQEEMDTKDEIQFPREHLEKTVHLLRKQTLKEHKWYHYRSARMGQEKDQNLRSINKLREDLETARQRCQDMETALGMSSQEIISDSLAARQKMEDVYAVVSKKDEKMKRKQKKLDNIILAQKKEISQLHALLYGSRVVK